MCVCVCVCDWWGVDVEGGVREKVRPDRVCTLAAATARLPHRRAVDLQVGLVTASRGAGAHALLDLGCHGHEGLLHVGGVLGTGLQEGDGQGIGKLLQRTRGGGGKRGIKKHLFI